MEDSNINIETSFIKDLIEVRSLISNLLKDDVVNKALITQLPALDNKSILNLISSGDKSKVISYINSLGEGVFV